MLGAWRLFQPIGSMIYFHRYLGDYNVFWGIGSAPLSSVYVRYGFPYPPSSLILVRAFGLFPFWPSFLLWCMAGVAAITLAAARTTPLRSVAVGFLSCAALGALVGGQTSLFIGALVMAGLSSRDPRLRGLFFASAAVIKPQSLLAAPVALLARQEWRTIGYAIAAGLSLIVASILLFGIQKWVDWATHLSAFPAYVTTRRIDVSDVGLYGLFRRMGLPGWTYLIGLPLGLLTTWSVFRSEGPAVDRYVAFACSTVLISPYTLSYDLAGLSIAAVSLLLDDRRSPLIWLAAALIISSVFSAIGIVTMAACLVREARRGTHEYRPERSEA